ncbi:MAG: archease [Nanoarchaeota archaeon]
MARKRKFKILENIAIADIAFEAYGKDLAELFENSAIATTSVMVELDNLKPNIRKIINLENRDIERLLFDFLNEIVFIKDSETMLFKNYSVDIKENEGKILLRAELLGEGINPKRQTLKIDVKAVTMHLFRIEKIDNLYIATVVLDI